MQARYFKTLCRLNYIPSKSFTKTRYNKIESILTKVFSPEYLEIVNESHLHSVPKDSETHFKIIIVSGLFKGKSKLEIHREVNSSLKDELEGGLHALSIVSFTPETWKNNPNVPKSPDCRGGSKVNKL